MTDILNGLAFFVTYTVTHLVEHLPWITAGLSSIVL